MADPPRALSERAKRRPREPANDADLCLLAPAARTVTLPFKPAADRRLPMPGTVLTRDHHDRSITVAVHDSGFEHAGTVYRSLTAVAKAEIERFVVDRIRGIGSDQRVNAARVLVESTPHHEADGPGKGPARSVTAEQGKAQKGGSPC